MMLSWFFLKIALCDSASVAVLEIKIIPNPPPNFPKAEAILRLSVSDLCRTISHKQGQEYKLPILDIVL